jgi:hypothetical protein
MVMGVVRRQKQEARSMLDPFRDPAIVCVETFRYGRVGALVEKGRHFTRDSAVVREHPQFFVAQVPLLELLANEQGRTDG